MKNGTGNCNNFRDENRFVRYCLFVKGEMLVVGPKKLKIWTTTHMCPIKTMGHTQKNKGTQTSKRIKKNQGKCS